MVTVRPDYSLIVLVALLVALGSTVFAIQVARGRIRFTLRTLLIATTMVAIVLGLIVAVQ